MSARWQELLVYGADSLPILLFAELTSRLGPVVFVPGVGYVISDPEVGRSILEDSQAFTKTGPGSMGAMITQVVGENALMNLEGADHRAMRTRLRDLFSVAYLDVLAREVLAEPAAALSADLVAGNRVDLVHFMHVLSGKMICHMLGIVPPAETGERVYLEMWALGEKLTAPPKLTRWRLPDSDVERRKVYFEKLVEHARTSYDRNDQGSKSIIQRMRGLGFTFEEIKGTIAALFTVGTQTVSAAVPRTVSVLADSGQLQALRQRPEMLASTIDEALRYVVPSPISLRSVELDRTVHGHKFKRGRRAFLMTYSMMKAERWYPNPSRFDPSREHDRVVKNLWFGAGQHFCLGSNLAHREIRTVLEVLIDLPGEIVIKKRRRAQNVLIPAYARLDVELAERKGAPTA